MQLAVSAHAQEFCSDPTAKTEVDAASVVFDSCMTSRGVHLGDPRSPSAAAACPEEMKRFGLATAACHPKLCANPKYEAAATEKFKAEMSCATREGTLLADGSGSEREVVSKGVEACEPVFITGVKFFTDHCSPAHESSAAEGWVWGQGMVVWAVALGAIRRARAAKTHGPGLMCVADLSRGASFGDLDDGPLVPRVRASKTTR